MLYLKANSLTYFGRCFADTCTCVPLMPCSSWLQKPSKALTR